MALTNFSLPYGGGALTPFSGTPDWITTANPIDNHNLNNLLYSPEGHQAVDHTTPNQQIYQNDPYAPPAQIQQPHQQNYQKQYRSRNHYLPPVLSSLNQRSQQQQQQQPQPQQTEYEQHPQSDIQPPSLPIDYQRHTQTNYQSHIKTQTYSTNSFVSTGNYYDQGNFNGSDVAVPPRPGLAYLPEATSQQFTDSNAKNSNAFPATPPVYTQVQAGHGTKTQVHAVLDYDNDDYYDPNNPGRNSIEPFVSFFLPTLYIFRALIMGYC